MEKPLYGIVSSSGVGHGAYINEDKREVVTICGKKNLKNSYIGDIEDLEVDSEYICQICKPKIVAAMKKEKEDRRI